MTKYPRSRITERQGLLHIENIVVSHGSIFRRVSQEDDIGIDGFIETVESENAEGLIVAVQIKSGVCYEKELGFEIYVNPQHLLYWQRIMLPVVIIAYSPTKQIASWIHFDYLLKHKNVKPNKGTNIFIPYQNTFLYDSLNQFRKIARTYKDEKDIFLKGAEYTLSYFAEERKLGVLMLYSHPTSRITKTSCYLASKLLLDNDKETVKNAVRIIGNCVSLTEHHVSEKENVLLFARECCYKFRKKHMLRMLEMVDEGDFSPSTLGEAVIYCIAHINKGQQYCKEIVLDKQQQMYIRANALVIFYAGDWMNLLKDKENLRISGLGDILDWLLDHN